MSSGFPLHRRHSASLIGLAALVAVSAAQAQERNRPRLKPGPAKIVTSPEKIRFGNCVDPAKTLTIAAVGDVLLHDSVQKWAAGQKDGFAGLFRPVEDILRAADIAIANLEGPAAEGVASNGKETRAPATRYDRQVYRGYPMFNYHPSIAADLKAAGFDVLLTANNHSLDRHQLGADRTIAAIKAAGLAYTGTRHREAMDAPWHTVTPVKAAGGTFNIAWLGCTYGTNEIPDRANQVLNCYNHRDEVLGTIRSLAAKPDIAAVFLVPHWGGEYQHKPDEKQSALAREVLEAGATGIIGSHPHVMQPIEKITTKDGRETIAAYSLGNFVSHQIGLPRRSAAILLLGLTPEKGKLAINAVGWIPIWMVTKGGMYAEAIDRSKDPAASKHREHLVRILPEGNLQPAASKFWQSSTCRS
jgi:poly-gamma-glutamate synthesis protein (capsule biosynthesis protein)